MERLTKKDYIFQEKAQGKAIYNKLADYENLEEQGLLVRLPCKVGDKIYWVSSNNQDIIEAIVVKITLVEKRIVITVYEEEIGQYNILSLDIFRSRKEAEKGLKELKGDERTVDNV